MSTIAYLVVAGGGGGGTGRGGGGGAGGLKSSGAASMTGFLTVTVGAGGAGSSANGTRGGSGSDSVLGAITAHGGGGGGSASNGNGINGGSGGGASGSSTASPGTGTGGEGNDGGSTTGTVTGGGGGGATGTGATGAGSGPRAGGAGSPNSITGSSVTYGVGGNGSPNTGGGSSGTANRGNGGQGADSGAAGNGGLGIVVVSFPTGSIAIFSQVGGVQTTSGGNTIITWTSSGSLTLDTAAIQPASFHLHWTSYAPDIAIRTLYPAAFVVTWTSYASSQSLSHAPVLARLSDGQPAAVSLGITPSGSIKANTLHIVDSVGQVQTCDVTITDIHGNHSYAPHSFLTITDGLATLFKGDIDETEIVSLESPYNLSVGGTPLGTPVGARLWNLKGQGLTHLAHRVLTGAFSAQARINISTVAAAISSPLGVAQNIATSPSTLLLPDSFLSEQETIADALTRLADLATYLSGIIHIWKIDLVSGSFVLTFQPITNLAASSSLGTGGYPVKSGSIQVRTTREQFANSVVLKLDRYLKDGGSKQTDTFDGGDIFLGTLKTTSPMAGEPTVRVEGNEETVGIKNVDTGMDWYWTLGSSVLTVGDSGAGSGDEVVVEYAAHDLRSYTASDTASIAAVGLFQVPLASEDTGNAASPSSQAGAELGRRNALVQHVTLTANVPSGVFSAGQLIAISLSGMGSSGQTPLSGYFYCRSIRTYDDSLQILWREFDLLRGPLLYKPAGFMQRLMR